MERICKIYTLAHPITGEIRYVGKTVETLHKRWGKHCTHFVSNNRRENWIKSVLKLGLRPIIDEIEEVPNSISSEVEQYWIAQFKAWGFRLINATDGGEGSVGFKHSEESKAKLSIIAKNRKMHEGTKEILRQTNLGNDYKLGKKESKETRKRKSDAKVGKIAMSPVIHIPTGIRYYSIKEAAIANSIVPQNLARALRRGCEDYEYSPITDDDIDYLVAKRSQRKK